MTRPYVTVLIDTYNHERFIEQVITSVLEQDFPAADREILVVDDGSTDRTADSLYLSVRKRWLPIPELENFSVRPNTQP